MATRGSGTTRSRTYGQQPQSIPRKRPAADDAEDAWVAEEDKFVLRQAKRKAVLRVRGGRARPIDWLAVTLRAIDPSEYLLDENEEDKELDVVDPEGVFEGLDEAELDELAKDIETYLVRETSGVNREFWTVSLVMKPLMQ
jgi:Conserved mid region of cactin